MRSLSRGQRVFVALAVLLMIGGGALLLVPTADNALAGILISAGAGSLFVALLVSLMPAPSEIASSKVRQRYSREFFPAMTAYVLVLPASIWLLKNVDLNMGLRAAVALLPVIPMALVLRAFIRFVRQVDEMQQRIELEAVSIATVVVSLLWMSAGFLQAAKVINVPSAMAMLWVFPVICLAYGIAKAFVFRRYQ